MRSGREVVNIQDLTHFYDNKVLFLGTDLLVERGDRIAFLGRMVAENQRYCV